MKTRTYFLINLCMTIVTCAFIISSCTGCGFEQLEKSKIVAGAVHGGLDSVPDVVKTQPWYIIAMIIADIASSALAAYIAYKKAGTPALKGPDNGNN